MQYKGMNLCDFCFEPLAPDGICHSCGLTHETYKLDAGLLSPGTNLNGKYIIGRVLGRGGFGATYLAFSGDRKVAIKEYFPNGIAYRGKGEGKVAIISQDKGHVFQKGAKRFYDEAKTMSKFNTNKNVVSVYEFFYANDTVYYSMEYLEGIDLKGYVEKKGGRLSQEEAVTIMRGVCDALVAVHSTGTLHRDISPDNIFICTNGIVKLIDFGAAKQVVGEQSQSLSVILKQGFAPVEQYKKDGKQGMWTDIYAVGATIYYAMTGKIPEDAMSRLENPDIVFAPELSISPEVTQVINKCMKIKVKDRYQSAIELLGDLQGLNIQSVAIGGEKFVQAIYNGVSGSPIVSGGNTQFEPIRPVGAQTGYNPYAQYPQSQYPNSQYPQSQYPQSQYPNSQYYSMSKGQPKNSEKNGILKGIIIGGAALIIIVLIIIIVVKLVSPQQPFGPGEPPPPGMQQGMPPGGGMPQGQPMPPPGQPMQQ